MYAKYTLCIFWAVIYTRKYVDMDSTFVVVYDADDFQ